MTDPIAVTHAQIRAAYDALGLDASRYGELQALDLNVTPDRISITRRFMPRMSDSSPVTYVTEIVDIPIARKGDR